MSLNGKTSNQAKLMVGIAGLAVSQDPEVSLCSAPLGACLGIAIYDPIAKVGGLLHTLLPSSSLDPIRAANRPGMFLDTGLAALLARAERLSATKENLRVFVAGAAQIMDETPAANIGKINCDFLGELLLQLGIKIYAQSVGGKTDCSMELSLASGEVHLKFSGQTWLKTLCKP